MEVVMEEIRTQSAAGRRVNMPVHSWDTHARRIVCGAPGQTGSTKHDRDVTCVACREHLDKLAHAALRVVPE
jgi:hypothetical protein